MPASTNFWFLTHRVAAQIVGGARSHQISAPGTYLFAPHYLQADVSHLVQMCDYGVQLDNTIAADYACFGPSTDDTTITGYFKITVEYAGSAAGQYTADDSRHAGIGIRYTDINNFAVVAMISASGGEFQVVCKVAGVETIYYKHDVSGGLLTNTEYKVVITSSGTDFTATLFTAADVQLDTYTGTFEAGTPASGYSFLHTYRSQAQFRHITQLDSVGAVLTDNTPAMVSVQVTFHADEMRVNSGVLDLYADGSGGSVNNWVVLLTTFKTADFVLTGSVMRKTNASTGRAVGFTWRSDGLGNGYHVWYDSITSGGQIKFASGIMTGVTSLQTTNNQGALTLDAWYPFRLSVSGANFSFTINGSTYTLTDTSITTAGYLGLVFGLGIFDYKDLDWRY